MQGIVRKGEVCGRQLILLQFFEPSRGAQEYTSVPAILVYGRHVTHCWRRFGMAWVQGRLLREEFTTVRRDPVSLSCSTI